MKTKSLILLVTLTIFVALSLMSCARKMSDEDYDKISEEFTEEFVQSILRYDPAEADLELDDFAYQKLDEVAKKSGFTADKYLEKAEELGETWDDIFTRIDERIDLEYRRMMDEMEQEGVEPLME